MAVIGISEYLANAWLGTLRNVPFTVPTTCIQLHTGPPGADGTDNVSLVTDRKSMTFSNPSGGATEVSGTPANWAMTGSETITHISVWDALSSGNFLSAATVRAPRVVANGDELILTGNDIEFPNLAA